MKTVDLTPLIENDQTFSKLSSDIRESYECNWDDPVHDSYRRFVQEATDGAAKLHEIRCKAETLKARMDEHNVEGLAREADNLWIEAQNV